MIIEKETFEIPCDVYGCNDRAVKRIGNLQGPPIKFFHLCKKHYKELENDILSSKPIREAEPVVQEPTEVKEEAKEEKPEEPNQVEEEIIEEVKEPPKENKPSRPKSKKKGEK